MGVDVRVLGGDAEGRVDLAEAAGRLGDTGYTSVLVEGGGAITGALFRAHLIDEAHLFLSRRILLGGGGPGWTEGLRVPSVARAVKIARSEMRPMGPDWWITFIPESAQWWDPETLAVETAPAVVEA